MSGLSFPRFKSMAALQRAAETMQEMGAAAKRELAERVDAKSGHIEFLLCKPKGHFKSFYRHEELTESAVRAGFKGARNLMDVMQAVDACRASPHFTESECCKMAVERDRMSSELFIKYSKGAELPFFMGGLGIGFAL